MVDDLLDIGTEVFQSGVEAVVVSNINPDLETEEIKKKKKHGLISGIITIILTLGLLYLIMWRWKLFNEAEMIVDELGIIGTLIAFGSMLIIILLIGIASYIKKQNKEIKKIYILIGISAGCTAFIISGIYPELDFSPMETITLVGFTFGITLMFIMLFHSIGDIKINQFLRLPYHLLMRFFIPMMFVCILVLGTMQGKYGYDSVFLEEAEITLLEGFGEVFGKAIYGIIEIIFNMAASRPNFFLFLSFAITLYLLYSTIRYAFWKDKWPYDLLADRHYNNNEDNDNEAEYFLNCADDKFLSKEDLESFKHGKLRLNKKYLEGGKDE